jgi:trimethylamine corrinoid protein
MSVKEELIESISNLDEDKALKLVEDLSKNKTAMEIISTIRKGMERVGEKFSAKEYYLAELVYSAEIFKNLMIKLEPSLIKGGQITYLGKVVIGTAKTDIHDLGKNLVASLLRAEGFEVIDLGVDVPPDRFVEAIMKEQPEVVGLSGLLTIAIEEMKNTIEAIKEKGLRDEVKIIIGGGPINEKVRDHVGADAFGKDAGDAIRKIKAFVS